MSKQYDDTNRGALFKNSDKEKDSHPDYKGNVNVGGVDYWLSAWIKKAESGRTYMSLSVQPKEKRQERAAPPPRQQRRQDDDSDVPF